MTVNHRRIPTDRLPLDRKGIPVGPCVKAVHSAAGGLDTRAAGSFFNAYEEAAEFDNVRGARNSAPRGTRHPLPSPSWRIRHKSSGGLPPFVVLGGGLVTAYFLYHSFLLFGDTASRQHGNDLVIGPGCGPYFLFHHTGIGRGRIRIGVGFQLTVIGSLPFTATNLRHGICPYAKCAAPVPGLLPAGFL